MHSGSAAITIEAIEKADLDLSEAFLGCIDADFYN